MLSNANESSSQSQLLTVTQAADYLGVHVATIRRWAYAKLLKGTKIGIRGDWRFLQSELEKMAQSNYMADTTSYLQRTPSDLSDWNNISGTSHFVQFYEDDTFLLESINKYIQTGDAAVVIATPEHRQFIEQSIQHEKSKANVSKRKYILLDALDTLSRFMVNGIPDINLFESVVGSILRDLAREYKNIRAYGEMVAILWANGNKSGAIRLEELWNNLQNKLSFTLYCAYPMKEIGGKDASDAFLDVCTSHSDVLPTENYLSLVTHNERLREIAILQQKAQALETTLKQLRLSEELNRNIVESSADCIKTLDLQGRLLSMNGPGCKLVEIDDINQIIGMDWVASWQGEAHDAAKNAIETAKNGGIGRFQGLGYTAKGKPIWMDVIVSPIFDEAGIVQKLVAVSRDITAIKELELRKDDFLSATSHELKTPLTSQKAFVQLLAQHIEKNKDVKYSRFVSKINEQTDKLTKLVNDLLDVSKVQGGKLLLDSELFDFNICTKEAVEEIQATIYKHTINVSGKISRGVYGDKEKISQVIINLLTNAIKYSPQSDRIDVLLKETKKEAIVQVTDYGIGIAPKDIDKVFDRFYRVSDSDQKTYPGLGMGLYIASEIINLHKGTIRVESTPGKGSTFSIRLPI